MNYYKVLKGVLGFGLTSLVSCQKNNYFDPSLGNATVAHSSITVCGEGQLNVDGNCVAKLSLCFLKDSLTEECEDFAEKKIAQNVCNENTVTQIRASTNDVQVDAQEIQILTNNQLVQEDPSVLSFGFCSRPDVFCYCATENKDMDFEFSAQLDATPSKSNSINLGVQSRSFQFAKFLNSEIIFQPDYLTSTNPVSRPQVHLLNFSETNWNYKDNPRIQFPMLPDGSLDLEAMQGIMPVMIYEGQETYVNHGRDHIPCPSSHFIFPNRALLSGNCIAVEDSIAKYYDSDYDFMIAAETQSITDRGVPKEQLRLRLSAISSFAAKNLNFIRIYFDQPVQFKIQVDVKSYWADGRIDNYLNGNATIQPEIMENGRYYYDLNSNFVIPDLRRLVDAARFGLTTTPEYGEIIVTVWDVINL